LVDSGEASPPAHEAPFDGGDQQGLLRRVQRGEFPPPRAVDPAVDRALEAICLKAMAREPGGRYAAAQALAGDLERRLAGEPVSAWREPWPVRSRRWLRRHRTPVAAAAASLLVAAVLGGAGGLRAVRDHAARGAQTTQEVLAAMGEATLKHAEARGAGVEKDLVPWDEALTAARRAARLAVRREVDEPMRRRVQGLLAELRAGRDESVRRAAAVRQDRAMVDRLAEIRTHRRGEFDPYDPDGEYGLPIAAEKKPTIFPGEPSRGRR
jgi:hypothetical protein